MSAASADEAAIRAEVEARDSVIAGLKTRAKAANYTMHIVGAGNGVFLLMRWGRVHECRTVGEANAFLDRVGAP